MYRVFFPALASRLSIFEAARPRVPILFRPLNSPTIYLFTRNAPRPPLSLSYRGRIARASALYLFSHPHRVRLAGWMNYIPKTLHWAAIDRSVVEKPTGKAADYTRSSFTANRTGVRKKAGEQYFVRDKIYSCINVCVCMCVLYKTCIILWWYINDEILRERKCLSDYARSTNICSTFVSVILRVISINVIVHVYALKNFAYNPVFAKWTRPCFNFRNGIKFRWFKFLWLVWFFFIGIIVFN